MADAAWIAERLARTKTLIVAYENAIEAISGGAQNYQLDTGQTRQLVTKANLASLQTGLERLEQRMAKQERELAAATGAATDAVVVARPGF